MLSHLKSRNGFGLTEINQNREIEYNSKSGDNEGYRIPVSNGHSSPLDKSYMEDIEEMIEPMPSMYSRKGEKQRDRREKRKRGGKEDEEGSKVFWILQDGVDSDSDNAPENEDTRWCYEYR